MDTLGIIAVSIIGCIAIICFFAALCFTRWLEFIDNKDSRDYSILEQDLQSEIDYLKDELEEVMGEANELRAHCDDQQAKIDALMLEYCPNEMSHAQLAEYEKHQKPISDEEAAKIDAAIKEHTTSTDYQNFTAKQKAEIAVQKFPSFDEWWSEQQGNKITGCAELCRDCPDLPNFKEDSGMQCICCRKWANKAYNV